jgi:tripartite-type tricarboxylate transporter receptor subunit TctC
MTSERNRTVRLLCAVAGLCAATPAVAQTAFPSRNVQLIVPYTAGGGADVVMRVVAQRLVELWGRNVVVENRAGASGMIGTELVARADPDGHVLLGHTSSYPATAAIREKLAFDPVRAIVPVATIARAPVVLVVHPSLPARSVKELVALAKAKPGVLNYSSAGTGGNNHFAAAMFATAAGVRLVHIPYKGVADAAVALVSGEVDLLLASASAIQGQVKSGRLRALAVSSPDPFALLPGLPAIAQSGVPGYSYELWWAIFAPAGIAAERRNQINAAVTAVVTGAEVKKVLQDLGAESWSLASSQLGELLPKEIERYRQAARAAGIPSQ